jgi:hypothetical protein
VALAGMPSITLTDVARLRLQSISFFVFGFLMAAWFIQLLWNYLRRDFTRLPRLSYGKAVAVVGLWGLLFILVLTMISGARELMTPGAWVKQGATYRLADQAFTGDPALAEARRHKLETLRVALWEYAIAHEGRFPSDVSDPAIAADRWQVPDPSGMRYLYVAGRHLSSRAEPLAFEPELFGSDRLVLLSNGEIRAMSSDDLAVALALEGQP